MIASRSAHVNLPAGGAGADARCMRSMRMSATPVYLHTSAQDGAFFSHVAPASARRGRQDVGGQNRRRSRAPLLPQAGGATSKAARRPLAVWQVSGERLTRCRLAADASLAPAGALGVVDQPLEVLGERRRPEPERPQQRARTRHRQASLRSRNTAGRRRPPGSSRRGQGRAAAVAGRTCAPRARSAPRSTVPAPPPRGARCRRPPRRRAARSARRRRSRSERCRRRPSGSTGTSSSSPRENARSGQ